MGLVQHQTVGSYNETLNSSDLFDGTIIAKASKGTSLKTSVTSGGGILARRFKGKRAVGTSDLSGTWNVMGSSAKVPFSETYTLTPSATYDHVFDLSGTGTSYSLSGSVLINSRSQLNISITNGVIPFAQPGKVRSHKGHRLPEGQRQRGQPGSRFEGNETIK